MRVLGIETSCDETAAAVVEDGQRILSNVVASQMELHRRFGGIVPEVASRQHLLSCLPVLRAALDQARVRGKGDLDAVAVTAGPGLVGSLLVGVNLAKALALAWDLPLVDINHLEAHLYASWLEGRGVPFPALCLVVSGGHTDLLKMEGPGRYRRLGGTRDDAAGEAFDKVARLLGLGFPGGPAIEEAARGGRPRHPVPRPWLRGNDDFSFSGLKTAMLHLVRKLGGGEGLSPEMRADLAASFQEAVVEVLAGKTVAAARREGARCILLAGGVAANGPLREAFQALSPVPLSIPRPALCTDNAAMVAACGYFRLQAGARAGWDLEVAPALRWA